MLRFCAFVVLAAVCFATDAFAQLVDFETTPAGVTPVDDAPLSTATPYVFPGVSISFGFDTDSNGSIETDPTFEMSGTFPGEPPNAGFAGSSGLDTPDPGFGPQLGWWFLRAPVGGSNFGRFVIQYTTALTITDASGEIWDIDGNEPSQTPENEQYRVRAYDASNNLLQTIDSPVGTLNSSIAPLDGQPWVFAFSGLSAGIDHIEITFIGTKPDGIGLAFNNFYPTTVPEPVGVVTLTGLMLTWSLKRPRR